MELKDSGTRREFASGAVRDICEGKGRCDLLPLDVVGVFASEPTLERLYLFQETGDVKYLYKILDVAAQGLLYSSRAELALEVAKHFEDGAKKYGDNNWRKGIDVHCYIDSAVRHYLKHLRGDTDEPHDRAFCWNIMACIWTCVHKPELNEYASKENV